MSYLNQAQDRRGRATAVVTVGAIHAVLAIGLVTGLTVDFTDIAETRFIGTTVPLDPPPKPEPTPTTPVEPVSYVPPAPTPKIDLAPTPGPERVEVDEADVITSLYPEGPIVDAKPGPTPAPPAFTPKRPAPSNGNWITDADYPRRAIVDEAEGSVGYRLVIATSGRVTSCELTRPSGNRALDDATCRLISGRARFEAATDETGAKVLGTYSGSVRWELPD